MLPQELDAGVPDMVRREAVNRLNRVQEFGGDLQHHTGRVIDGVREGGKRAVEAGVDQGQRWFNAAQDRAERIIEAGADQGRRLVNGAREQGERVIDGVREGVRDGGERLQSLARQGVLPPNPITAPQMLAAQMAARLTDPQPPQDPLYRQAFDGLKTLDPQKLGFRSEQNYQNAAGTLALEARVNGLSRIDHVLANRDGTGLFAVQGGVSDPGHHRVYVDTAQAAAQPLAQSTQQLQQETRRQVQEQSIQQQQPSRGMTH